MKLLFKIRTYEVSYKNEIIRFVSLVMLFAAITIVSLSWKGKPRYLHIIFSCLAIYLPFMFCWSGLRMSQIQDNKKNAIAVKKSEFYKIINRHPNSKFLILLGNKYIVYNSSVDLVGDEVTIVRKDNNYISKNDI